MIDVDKAMSILEAWRDGEVIEMSSYKGTGSWEKCCHTPVAWHEYDYRVREPVTAYAVISQQTGKAIGLFNSMREAEDFKGEAATCYLVLLEEVKYND